MARFANRLHYKFNGHAYRVYAGIRDDRIPCEADFSNFRVRVDQERYQATFHVLVEIVRMLGLITGRILSVDGTLVPPFARYRGCNYASRECQFIRVRGDFISRTRARILKLLENPSRISIGKELRAYAKCPRRDRLPEGVKPPSVQVCAFKIVPLNPDLVDPRDQTARLFGVVEALSKRGLMILPSRSNISRVDMDLRDNPVYVKCPRMPADLEARIGYRISKYNPNRKQKVFGF